MKKLKIIVYAICKNEEKFVDRWVESMSEADEIYVLDTGSTDNTVEKLKCKNVNVESIEINPFRFDIARNKSLDLVPNDVDVCVCTDLDEVFVKGWREKIESIWESDTNRLRYTFNWKLDNDIPKVSFFGEKIHSRSNYNWINPVHEVLKYQSDNELFKIDESIILNHYPDESKSRSSYLPLLELAVLENPLNDRNMHYLGREYMYYGMNNECIDTLIEHLNLESATWKDERAASMRFIARSYLKLKRIDEAKMWLDKAIIEAPYLRDAYVEYALLEYKLNNWKNVIKYSNKALEIKHKAKSYINEISSWDNTLYDILSIAYFRVGEYSLSLENIIIALSMNPSDNRLIENKKIIELQINKDI